MLLSQSCGEHWHKAFLEPGHRSRCKLSEEYSHIKHTLVGLSTSDVLVWMWTDGPCHLWPVSVAPALSPNEPGRTSRGYRCPILTPRTIQDSQDLLHTTKWHGQKPMRYLHKKILGGLLNTYSIRNSNTAATPQKKKKNEMNDFHTSYKSKYQDVYLKVYSFCTYTVYLSFQSIIMLLNIIAINTQWPVTTH